MTIRTLAMAIGAALGALLIGSVLAVLVAGAAEPTTCTFPASGESFESVSNMSYWTAPHHNRLLCVVNRLISRSLEGGYLEQVCQDVSIPAATRQLVTFGLGSAVTTGTSVIPTATDSTNPARVIPDGVQQVSGTVATAWFFNRDASSSRSIRACVQVRRS